MRLPSKITSILLIAVIGVFAVVGGVAAKEGPQQQQFAVPIMVVNTSFLNVRTGPGGQFSVLTTVVGGTELPVLGTAGDDIWYQVSTPVGVGWVNAEFVLARGDFTNVPLVDAGDIPVQQPVIPAVAPQAQQQQPTTGVTGAVQSPTVATSTVPGIFRAATRDAVNVFQGPSRDSGAITVLLNQTDDFPITGQVGDGFTDWLRIEVPGIGSGWVEGNRVDVRLARTIERDVIVVTAESIALTLGPGGGNDGLLPFVSEGQEGYLVNISQDGNFVQIQLVDGTVGWLPFSAVRQRTGTTTDENPLPITGDPLALANQFTVPSTSGLAPSALEQGGGPSAVVVQPLSEQGGGPNNVFVQPPALDIPVVIINTSFLNIRSGPGAQFTVVTTVRGGTELQVIGLANDGVWFLVQGPFGQGWLNNEFVLFRGNIDNVPLIENASGTIATPTAVIGGSTPLYAAPGVNFGTLGTVVGPVEAPIVARTSEFDWVQINTTAGFGWVQAELVSIRGDASLIPIINQ